MPPVQRGHLFSVPDVVAAIQNIESDFEMESDDTDASHSEQDEETGEMDKENRQPTDCPANDDMDALCDADWKNNFINPSTDFSGL